MSRQLTVQETEIFERLPEHIKRDIETLMVQQPDMSLTDMLSVATSVIEEVQREEVSKENLETISTGATCRMPRTILGKPAREPSAATTIIFEAVGHPLASGDVVKELTLLESSAAIFIMVHPNIKELIQLAKDKEKFYDAVTEFAFDLEISDIVGEIKTLLNMMPDEAGGDEDDDPNPTGSLS